MEMAEEDNSGEEYPNEIHDYLSAFEKSLGSVGDMLKTMMSVSRSELLEKVKNNPQQQPLLLLFIVLLLTCITVARRNPIK